MTRAAVLQWLRAHGALVAAVVVAVAGVTWLRQRAVADAFARDRAVALEALARAAAERDQVAAALDAARAAGEATRRSRDSLERVGVRHAARAAALEARLAAITPPPAVDTAALVPRARLEFALDQATEWRAAYLAADSARALEMARAEMLVVAVEEARAHLAAERDRAAMVQSVVARAAAPCRVLFVPCPTRTTAFVAGAVTMGAVYILTHRGG